MGHGAKKLSPCCIGWLQMSSRIRHCNNKYVLKKWTPKRPKTVGKTNVA